MRATEATPYPAATLIVHRGNQILLGLRSHHHVFMPHVYVFPGGRLDAADRQLQVRHKLPDLDLARLGNSVDSATAQALALTAIRETFEETGLRIAHRTPNAQTDVDGWTSFHRGGFEPAVDQLSYFARAITPPGSKRRFDARFFLVDASFAHGHLRGNGELEDLRWVELARIDELKTAPVTSLVLELLKCRLGPGEAQANTVSNQFEAEHGREVFEYYL